MTYTRAASVLLFNSPVIRKQEDVFQLGNLYPRIGVASIAAVLLEHGHKVTVFDPQNEPLDRVKETIQNAHPDIVGIPAYTQEFFDAAYTAELVKAICPNALTILGGPHASAIPEQSLKEGPSLDIAVIGEGEITTSEIASGKPLAEIKGLAWRSGGVAARNEAREPFADLDSLPFPAWQLYDLRKYGGSELFTGSRKKGASIELPVEGARGCPFDCYFCYKLNGRHMAFKSAKRVIDDIERNVKTFGATRIHIVEGTFGVKRKLAEELCDEIINRGLNKTITWETGGNFKVLDKELLAKMKEAGCRLVGFGVETGSQEVLERIGSKATNLKRIEEVIALCDRIGVDTEACFIFGHPFETEKNINETIKFASGLKTRHANFAIMVPFPGSQVAEMAEKHTGGLRILTRDWRVYGKQIGAAMDLEQLPQKKLLQLQARAYRKFYLHPRRIMGFAAQLSLPKIFGILKRSFGSLSH